MSDLLRRSLAPLTDAAWKEIDDLAKLTLRPYLSARRIVDFDGPHGWELASVNLGRLHIAKEEADGVSWGQRQVLPLIEVRVPFQLNQMELDTVSRGAKDADLAPLEQAAAKVATFEERAVYEGFSAGGVKGIIETSSHKPAPFPADSQQEAQAVGTAIQALQRTGIGGPYALVLSIERYNALRQSTKTGYPVYRVIERMADGGILWSPAIAEGGVIISTRGGDYEMTVGQDLSIGYMKHDATGDELYLTESFTFRVFEPAAAVRLEG